MNFLAHAFLSFGHEKILVGNFIADFVKGKQIEKYEKQIQIGIQLHRAIDLFTDSHPLVKAAQTYLRPKFGHYSSVITDVFFDYFLIKCWDHFSEESVEDFIQEVYGTLDRFAQVFPTRFEGMYYWMKKENWLFQYGEIKGIQKALTGMAKRAQFDSKMEQAHFALIENEDEFEVIFFAFFKELESFAYQKLIELEKQA